MGKFWHGDADSKECCYLIWASHKQRKKNKYKKIEKMSGEENNMSVFGTHPLNLFFVILLKKNRFLLNKAQKNKKYFPNTSDKFHFFFLLIRNKNSLSFSFISFMTIHISEDNHCNATYMRKVSLPRL
jgi:hypothetical protein